MKQASVLIALFLVAALAGCSTSSSQESMDRAPLTTLPQDLGQDAGLDVYEDAEPTDGADGEPLAPNPTPTSDSEQTGIPEDDLFAGQKTNINCLQTGELAMEYSALAATEGESAAITEVLDSRLEEDWTATVTVPAAGERVPVIKCWARVRWSIGWDSDVDLWLLLDSDRNLRVRWDNIREAVEIEADLP
jgi:hypothetical protein